MRSAELMIISSATARIKGISFASCLSCLNGSYLAELIDHIDVYHAEKCDGVTNQRVTIYYNCIGAFDVPDRRKIPEADIIMETRKGVAISYAQAHTAV